MRTPRSSSAGAGPDRRSLLLNLAAYQVGWFACVLGAAGGWDGGGAAIAAGLAMAHLALAERPGREWPLLLVALGLGALVETLHLGAGILEPRGQAAVRGLPPFWLLALWLQFGTVFHFCLRWLSGRYRLAFGLGLVGGPLAFLAGERLGAASLGEPRALSIAVLALVWAVAVPTLVWIADRLGPSGRYRLFRSASQVPPGGSAESIAPPRQDRSTHLV